MDITEVPLHELIVDRIESLDDITTCEAALCCGVETYSGGLVQERLDANKKIVAVIDAEIARRNAALTAPNLDASQGDEDTQRSAAQLLIEADQLSCTCGYGGRLVLGERTMCPNCGKPLAA